MKNEISIIIRNEFMILVYKKEVLSISHITYDRESNSDIITRLKSVDASY